MIDFSGTSELIYQAIGVFKHHVPPEHWPNTNLWALIAVPAGLILAFWGASLLRTAYVLGFMVLGGAAGVRFAGTGQVDLMIGLVLGAGLAALVGHLLFRLWLGVTAGGFAILLVAVLGAGRISDEVRKFEDQRLGTGAYVLPETLDAPSAGEGALMGYLKELQAFFYEKNQDFLYGAGIVGGLAFLVGMTLAMFLPQWTMIVGTSLIGTLTAGAGSAALASSRWPEAWAAVLANPGWALGGFAALFLIGLLYQAQQRRGRVPAAPVVPAPA
jgi:hypothetical protein